MNRIITFFFIIVLITNIPISVFSQEPKKAYVSDILILTVRRGPGRNFEIFKTIESNEKVLILEDKDNYSKIQLKNGETGWVQSQYLTFKTPDNFINAILNKKIKKLELKNNQQLKKINTLKINFLEQKKKFEKEKIDLKLALSKLLSEKEDYIKKYTDIKTKYNELINKSNKVVQITKENETLKKFNKKISADLKDLKYKNKTLLKVGMIKWFLAGAGILLMGWIIGHSVSIRGSRRSGLLR